MDRIIYGGNKEEVVEQEHESNKKLYSKPEREPEPDVNCPPGYIFFKPPENSQDCEEPNSAVPSEMSNYASLIYKSLDDICNEVKKISQPDTIEESEEVKPCIYTKQQETYQPEAVQYENLLPIQMETQEDIYSEIKETCQREQAEEPEEIEKIVELTIECIKCKSIKRISDRSQKLIGEISETKTRLKSYRSKVDQLEKENKSAASFLNSLCGELENKRTPKVASRLNNLFSRVKKPETRSLTDQIKIIADHIQTAQKVQNNQAADIRKQKEEYDALQKKYCEAQQEIKDLKDKLNLKISKRKSTWFEPRLLKHDVSIQVAEETFENQGESPVGDLKVKNLNWLKMDASGPRELTKQLEEMKLQISGILNGLQGTQPGVVVSGDTPNVETNLNRENMTQSRRKIMGDKEEVVD